MFCSTHIHDRDFKDVFFSNNHQWIAFVLPKIILPGSKLISPLRNNIPQHYTTRLIRDVFQLSLDSVAAIAKKGPVIWMVNHLNDPSDLNNHISNTRRHKTDIP